MKHYLVRFNYRSSKAFNKAADKYHDIDKTVVTHGTLDIDIFDTAKIKEINTDAKGKKIISFLSRD